MEARDRYTESPNRRRNGTFRRNDGSPGGSAEN